MSSPQGSGPAPVPVNARREADEDGEDDVTPQKGVDRATVVKRPKLSKLSKRGKSRKSKKPARQPLRERLPDGMYDDRPQDKRYVLHWLVFWLYVRLRLYKTKLPVPQPAIREQRDRGMAELFELAETKQPTIAALNSKGGAGKTVLSTWLAVLISLATERAVYAVDANENKGGTAGRLGVDREKTLRLRDFLRYERELSDGRSINDALASHKGSGVLVIASDAQGGTRRFSQMLFERRMNTLRRCGSPVVFDVGNGIDHATNRGSVSVADVLMFPTTIMQADSFSDAEDTRKIYASDERYYGFGDKVREGLIVLMGVSDKERDEYIETYSWNPEKVFVVPRDRYMIGKHVVNWRKIRPRTQRSLVEIALEVYRTAPTVESWKADADVTQHESELSLPDIEEAVLSHYNTPEGR